MYNGAMKTKSRKVRVLQYNAVFQQETDGGFSVWVPSLLGCTSQGETFEEAMKNVKEAIELYLEDVPEVVKHESEAREKQFLVPVSISYA